MAIRTEKLVVTRGDLAKAFDRAFAKFAEATELEIDQRVEVALAAFREELRPKRRWFAPWRKP